MIATSRYGPLLFLSTILTTIFHPNGICVAFHSKSPFLRRSLASAPAATSTIISSSFRKNEGSFYYDSVSKNPLRSHHLQINDDESSKKIVLNKEKSLGLVVCLAVVLPLLISPSASLAADDTASTTVATAVQNLIDAVGDKDKSFEALKDVADIITDGKGVGGSLTYSGVQLEGGLVSDEDTMIYNPGLTLLSESEKTSLVDAVIQNRKSNMLQSSWSEDNQLGYEFLKQKLDPFHTVELKGYLKILPFYGAAVYLATLFIQQNARQFFTAAYIAGAVMIFAPIFVLISIGA